MFMSVPNATKPNATNSCVPDVKGSIPSTIGTNPAAP
jgi:hypothetical protein